MGICFWTVKDLLINSLADQEAIVTLINKVFPYVGTIVNLIITTGVTAWTKAKIEIIFNAPQISIRPEELLNCNGCNVSGEKRERPIAYTPRINIGEETATYRIVFSKITNVGKVSISECTINGQTLSLYLDPEKNSDLYFVLFLSEDPKQNIKGGNRVILPYKIRDINGNTYAGSYYMSIDTSYCKTTFNIYKKIKRERS